jgi:hypothetical protein
MNMAALTEEQIEKIARNLITAPHVMESLPEFDKLRREDDEGDFRAILQKAYHLVKDGFKEFGDATELPDVSLVWVLKQFVELDLSTKIMCLKRGLSRNNSILISLSLDALAGLTEEHDFKLNFVTVLALMNKVIHGAHDDTIKTMAWNILGKADAFGSVSLEDWKSYTKHSK